MKTRIISLIFLVIILAIATGAADGFRKFLPQAPWNDTNTPVNNHPDQPVVCTMDAMMCPDGSYVGRVAPACQFAACPVSSTTPVDNNFGKVSVKTRINDTASALGFSITVREIIEDSRCPVDVFCIQAGTVKIKATLQNSSGSNQQLFILGQPVITETGSVELVGVEPDPHSGNTINLSDYRFIFKISKNAPPQAI